LGIVDHPDSERKLHAEPVALGGGLAIYGAVVVTFAATVLIDRAIFGGGGESAGLLGFVSHSLYILFGAAGVLLFVGLIDDTWVLRGRQKLLLQCLILFALVGGGTLINQINVLGFEIELGILAFPITVVWLLLAVNALNLIDGADGMATTAGCVISAGLGIVSIFNGSSLSAVIAFALAASLLAFLVFNRPPASIYLGDAGSMTIGLFVGVLAVWSSVKESTILASAPVAILAIPLFDSTAAILRRWLTGRSLYTTDRAHLHHLLQERLGPIRMLFVVAGLCVTTTSMAVMSVVFNQPWLAVLGVIMVTVALIGTRSFGYAEVRLVIGRAIHFAQSFATHPTNNNTMSHDRRIALQGVERWDTIWDPLVQFAKGNRFAKIKIDLNLAWLHEGYHAHWQSVRLPERPHQLQVSIPLFVDRSTQRATRVPIGRLEVIAGASDPDIYDRISELSDYLRELMSEIERMINRLESTRKGIGLPDSRPAESPAARTTLEAPIRSGNPVAASEPIC
jgi:UDP-GlcNAc:undecaprenyl-phosphate GlcNAc-1-phosphate transferase